MDALRKPPFSFDVVVNQKELFPSDPNLIYYPLIYIHGRAALSFAKEDLDALRRHLEPGGGTLFADAACGSPAFDAAFRRFVAELLPGNPAGPDPPRRRALLHQGRLRPVASRQYTKAAGGGKDFPQLEGVKINGHWAIIYSKYDIGCALERHSGLDCKGYYLRDGPQDRRQHRHLLHAAVTALTALRSSSECLSFRDSELDHVRSSRRLHSPGARDRGLGVPPSTAAARGASPGKTSSEPSATAPAS